MSETSFFKLGQRLGTSKDEVIMRRGKDFKKPITSESVAEKLNMSEKASVENVQKEGFGANLSIDEKDEKILK